jgi:hypothetical protein
MQDSSSIRNNIDRTQAGEETGKPLAPLWIFKVMNPIMKGPLLKGHRVQAIPTVIEQREVVIDTLEEFIKRLGPQTARRLPIDLPRDREPTQDDLRNVPRGIALIHFRIVKRFEGS